MQLLTMHSKYRAFFVQLRLLQNDNVIEQATDSISDHKRQSISGAISHEFDVINTTRLRRVHNLACLILHLFAA